MGGWEFLTMQRGLGSAAFRWNEPWLFRIRLRGDLLRRFAIMLAGWGLATGVLLALFAVNVKPQGIPLALGLGAVFGLGPAWLAMFFLSGPYLGSRDSRAGRSQPPATLCFDLGSVGRIHGLAVRIDPALHHCAGRKLGPPVLGHPAR